METGELKDCSYKSSKMKREEEIKQELIKRACNWLDRALNNFCTPKGGAVRIPDKTKQKFIECFKKAMEE